MKVRNLVRKIALIEGFDVRIEKNGRKVNSNSSIDVTYSYKRAAGNDQTVQDVITQRLEKTLPGYDVKVLDGSGKIVAGQTKLKNVRAGYEE